MTADEWRERLAALPHKEIHRLLKSEPTVATQVIAGFRPGAESLKSPVVLKRLAEALPKNPKLAEAVEKLEPYSPPPGAEPIRLPTPSASPETSTKETNKLKEQRAALKEKDRLLTEQALRLAELEKERDAVRTERDAERKEREYIQAKLERERRRKAPEPVVAPLPVASPPTTVTKELLNTPAWVPDALTRLLLRGHDATVLALCRELLTDVSLPMTAQAGVRSVYARALESLGAPEAPEQCRLATEAALNAGQLVDAGELLLCAFTKATPSTTERALLQRLLALAERQGELETLGRLFARQRLAQPLAFACLCKGLETFGKKYPTLVPVTSVATLGADSTVALPTRSKSASSVTPRQLVAAIDSGDTTLVQKTRTGLSELGRSNPSLADALLTAVGTLSQPALATLTAPRIRPIVVDASNVARHIADPLAAIVAKKQTASLPQLLQLRAFLLEHGFFPVYCIADANLRHLVTERSRYAALVDAHIIRETLPGTSADELLLTEARAHHAPLLTNDRMADWGKRAEGIDRLGFTLHQDQIALIPSG